MTVHTKIAPTARETVTGRRILEGVRVLDFTQVIAGGYGTAILADMGAEVIKVECPPHGDGLRGAGPLRGGVSTFFMTHNRNKKSICVDLKTAEGVSLIRDLVPHCTVVAENFKPGVMDRLGLGYADLRRLKDDIIYLSVSGYGHGNKHSHRAAYDNIIQAESGLAMQNGPPGSDAPSRCPVSMADYTAGLYGALAMVSAIHHHSRTGEGQFIDVAMYDALLSVMDNTFLVCDAMAGEWERGDANATVLREEAGLTHAGNRHPGAAPHGFYRTLDGHVAHMSLTNEMWHGLLRLMGRPELVGDRRYERLVDRRAAWREIDTMIEEWTRQRTTDQVMALLEEHRLPCGRARTADQAFADPHNRQRQVFHEVDDRHAGRVRLPNVPIKFSRTPTAIRASAPAMGEHNGEVLVTVLGYSPERVEALAHRGVLTGSPTVARR